MQGFYVQTLQKKKTKENTKKGKSKREKKSLRGLREVLNVASITKILKKIISFKQIQTCWLPCEVVLKILAKNDY